MEKLFGIPVGSLLVVLVGLLAIALGVVVALAVRNRIFLRLGLRNAGRRRGRTALIVVGLMLGTAIIAAALATGDTMSHTIRSSAVSALGRTDEVIAAPGLDEALSMQSAPTSARYFPESYVQRIARTGRSMGLVDGVEPVIAEPVAIQDVSSRQNEPVVTLFASDPARMRPFGPITSSDGRTVSLADLRRGEVYLNRKAADELRAHAGDTIRILAGHRLASVRVRAIVQYEGAATDQQGVMMPLARAQALFDKPGLVRVAFVANKGGVGATDEVINRLSPTLERMGLVADNTKQNALDVADQAGAAFMAIFTTFGSFSIAAGILLIFLIFVMLAAERRTELGIARAVGTRRRSLVQMFVYEGLAYDLLAALVGALVGIALAYGMVFLMARSFSSALDFHVSYSVKPGSVLLAYAIGVLLTLVVVLLSARKVSRMNIVSAIRSLPEPAAERSNRKRRLFAVATVILGCALFVSGASSKQEVVLGLGFSLVVISLVPLALGLGVPERVAHTVAGLLLVAWFVLPISRWLFGETKVNFSIFILGGLMIVVGATWTIMYNADVLLGAVGGSLGRMRRLAPVLRMSMAYPLRSLFRTGVTLAMFTLVVFTLVTGAITTGSFVNGFNDVALFGGGFDVRATASPASPITNMRAALASTPALQSSDFRVVSAESVLPVKARQVGSGVEPEPYLVHGVDNAFLEHTTYQFGAMARGYSTPADVWRAVRTHPGLAVVDPLVVPRRANWNMGPPSKFKLSGFYLEDKTFTPVRMDVRDSQTGRVARLTVIGVLADSVPQFMAGVWTSQRTASEAFGDRVLPTDYLFALGKGVDPKATATKLESAFLANGMQADSMKKLLSDAVSASVTFNRIIMGFMGLGLLVGVAALGVITARSVVERRQQIGVLRAIGFRRRMVQLAFLLESSFVAVTAIVVGTALGLVVGFNVIHDATRQPGMESVTFDVPWVSLAIIFSVVYLVALGTTLLPAIRASRIYPAQALRYE